MSDRSAAMSLTESFLGAPADMADWRVAELAHRKGILATWLSEIEMTGGTLDSGPAEYLARAWRRVQLLHSLGADLATVHDVTLIKGSVIAQHMPVGVLRQSGDVGVVTRDEATLWRVVFDVQLRCDAIVRGLSVLSSVDGDRQLGVWLKWPAEEPYLDKPMGAVVSTCAFTGDLKQVGVRASEIEDGDLLSLFAVAEERFQRKFRVGDLIDLAVLVPALVATYGDGLAETVCGWAAKLCLAPELLQLSRLVTQWWSLPEEWDPVEELLTELSIVECETRRTEARVMHRARYGIALDEVPGTGLHLEIHPAPDCELATTPVGTFLLVPSAAIEEDTYQRGVVAARSLHRRHGTSPPLRDF
jgi:hypothetical protein